MGNVFYALLSELWPFNDEDSKEAQDNVKNGRRPHLPRRIIESKDPADKVLQKAMRMCWRQNPKERATAREVADTLHAKLKELKIPTETR